MKYPKKPVVLGLLCNLFHFYAFSLYLFSAIILSPIFFGSDDLSITRTLGLITICLSLLVKPLGAVLFGHLGDRRGTQRVLMTSLVPMSIATACIGLIPSAEVFGSLSGVLLIICLCVQGMCIGGQYTGSLLYIQEHMAKDRAAFACGLVASIGVVGTLLANLTNLLFEYTTPQVWGWRIPFVLTLFLGCILIYFMSPVSVGGKNIFPAKDWKASGDKLPLMNILMQHKTELYSAAILSAIPISMFYLATVYVPNFFFEQLWDHPRFNPLILSCFSQALCILFIPIFSLLGDSIGKRPTLIFASLIVIFLCPLVFGIIDTMEGSVALLVASLFFCMIVSLYVGTAPAFLSEVFPKDSRLSGMGLGISLGEGIFGGLVPMVCIFLQSSFDSRVVPAFFISFLGILCLPGILMLRVRGIDKSCGSVSEDLTVSMGCSLQKELPITSC